MMCTSTLVCALRLKKTKVLTSKRSSMPITRTWYKMDFFLAAKSALSSWYLGGKNLVTSLSIPSTSSLLLIHSEPIVSKVKIRMASVKRLDAKVTRATCGNS